MPDRAPLLDKVDPVLAWQAWEPDGASPWNLKWAGHLFRRAAFGASLERLNEAVKQGVRATVDGLLSGLPDSDNTFSAAERDKMGELIAQRDEIEDLRGWWLSMMLHGSHPLAEKLTLFWHNHFATSFAKVGRTRPMFIQNRVLYRHALGSFPPLLLDVSRDPAMLIYLDSNSNIRGKPNENYARELMELFTLGVGNYTEKDVREAARAFTGWHTTDDRFDFAVSFHDDGSKTVLGQTGNWDGPDVVRILLDQPTAARFLVRKLYRFFVNETAEPPAALLEPLAESFRRSGYDIKALVGTILRSRHFFSAQAYRQRIKSPVELVLGTVNALRQGPAMVPTDRLVNALDPMGQPLFAPPNVKGWVGGRSWLNTATVVARNNFGRAALDPTTAGLADVGALLRQYTVKAEAGSLAPFLARLLLQEDLGDAATARLSAHLSAIDKPELAVREGLFAVLTLPEYQLA